MFELRFIYIRLIIENDLGSKWSFIIYNMLVIKAQLPINNICDKYIAHKGKSETASTKINSGESC